MLEKIKVSELDHLKENYSTHMHLPIVTHSIAIGMEQLKEYLEMAKTDCPGFNGLRFYFVRYDMTKDLPYVIKAGHSHLSQVSVAIVPIKDFDPYTLQGDDYPLADNKHKILALSICPPAAGDWDEGTGMCPPKCNH